MSPEAGPAAEAGAPGCYHPGMTTSHLWRFLPALVVAAAAAAQDPPPPDPALPDRIKELKSFCTDPKMESDFRAIGSIRQLVAQPDKLNPKDKEKLAKAFGDVFTWGKVRPPDSDLLYREAGDALAKLGADGAKELLAAIEHSRFKDRDYIPLRAHLLKALGKTKDEKQVDYLVEQARRAPWDQIMAAAGEALGNYDQLELKQRRDVVKQLIIKFGEVHGKASQLESTDPSAPIDLDLNNARDTLQKIQGPFNRTLAALTGQSFSSAPDWRHWLNKNPNWGSK